MQGLCDTGATRSVISADLAKRLKLKVTKSQLINPFLPANGQPMCPLGQVSINVNIQGLIIPTIVYVVNNLHPKLILGNDWLKSTRAVIDYRTGILSLYDDLLLCPLEGFNSRHNCVTLRLTVCLQPYSESILPVQVPQKYSSSSVLIEPLLDQSALPVRIAGTLCTTRGCCGIVRVLNSSAEPITVRRFTKLGTISTINCINTIQPLVRPKETKNNDKIMTQTPEILEAFSKKYKFQISTELWQEQRYELLNVLYEFKDTFALEITDMKIHQNYTAHLELKQPGMTVRARQFPLSTEDSAEIDKQILQMEEMGLIEKTEDTTFNSPIFLIKKMHTGKTPICRRLAKGQRCFKAVIGHAASY